VEDDGDSVLCCDTMVGWNASGWNRPRGRVVRLEAGRVVVGQHCGRREGETGQLEGFDLNWF
jgi:hypothetical protein